MLLTTCPNCSAQFKVQPEQLNVRQGRVMCGRCRNVFNAFQSLTRVSDNDAAIAAVLDTPSGMEEPVTDLVDHIFLREEPLPLSHDFTARDFAPVEALARIAPPAIDITIDPESASDSVEIAPTPPFTSLLPAIGMSPDSPGENRLLSAPVSSRNSYRDENHAGRWSAGAAFLLLLLFAQLAYGYRSAIIQLYPSIRPSFVSACEWAGCSLPWARDESAIRIEASDLIETPGKSGHIQLTATLVNRSATRQELPSLELKLTDSANQVILSRILSPREYLGRPPTADDGLIPSVELYVNLYIELANKTQASGYGVRAFYSKE